MEYNFKGNMKGSDIMNRNSFFENKLEPNRIYNYKENGQRKDGLIECDLTSVDTEEEVLIKQQQEEVQEINEWLDLRRNISVEDLPEKAVKQARLLELLG